LPKRGFISLSRGSKAEIRLSDLGNLPVDTIDLLVLQQAGVVSQMAKNVRVILAGAIEKPVKLVGIAATKGAKAAIEAAGGSVEG
jgi:large subunit ribosomal protein L15